MRVTLTIAGLYGATALALKAVARHSLPPDTSDTSLQAFTIATDLQLLHGVLLIACGWLRPHFPRFVPFLSVLVLVGTFLFCVPIYAHTLLGAPAWVHAVTPIGGVLLIAGWTCLAILPWVPSDTGAED